MAARADRQLIRWAESVGHRRIWFPDRLVHLKDGAPLGVATVECPTCGARLGGREPRLLVRRAVVGSLPDDLRDLQRRPAAVAVAAETITELM